MTSLLGTSWKTTLMGYLVGLSLVVEQAIQAGTLWPSDWGGRMHVIGGLLIAAWGRFQKDYNVSNAPAPANANPVPSTVTP